MWFFFSFLLFDAMLSWFLVNVCLFWEPTTLLCNFFHSIEYESCFPKILNFILRKFRLKSSIYCVGSGFQHDEWHGAGIRTFSKSRMIILVDGCSS